MHLHAKSSASGAERKCPTTKQNASPSKKNILTPVSHHPPHLHPKDHGAQPQPPCTNHQGRGPGPDTQTSGLSKAARVKPCSAIPITAQPRGVAGWGCREVSPNEVDSLESGIPANAFQFCNCCHGNRSGFDSEGAGGQVT